MVDRTEVVGGTEPSAVPLTRPRRVSYAAYSPFEHPAALLHHPTPSPPPPPPLPPSSNSHLSPTSPPNVHLIAIPAGAQDCLDPSHCLVDISGGLHGGLTLLPRQGIHLNIVLPSLPPLPLPTSTSMPFLQVARTVVEGGKELKVVTLVAVTIGYANMLMSFICRLRMLGLADNILVAALDEELYRFAFTQGLAVYYEQVRGAGW